MRWATPHSVRGRPRARACRGVGARRVHPASGKPAFVALNGGRRMRRASLHSVRGRLGARARVRARRVHPASGKPAFAALNGGRRMRGLRHTVYAGAWARARARACAARASGLREARLRGAEGGPADALGFITKCTRVLGRARVRARRVHPASGKPAFVALNGGRRMCWASSHRVRGRLRGCACSLRVCVFVRAQPVGASRQGGVAAVVGPAVAAVLGPVVGRGLGTGTT